MPFTYDDVRRLIEIAEKEGWDEVRVETDDITFIWSTSPDATVEPLSSREGRPEDSREQASGGANAGLGDSPQRTIHEVTTSTAPMEIEREVNLVEVTAPYLGIFWCSPKPGAPPFVELGSHVEPDDTLCIIEVMKLMNQVKAGITGEVVAIHVSNGEMIEYGQPIMSIVAEDR